MVLEIINPVREERGRSLRRKSGWGKGWRQTWQGNRSVCSLLVQTNKKSPLDEEYSAAWCRSDHNRWSRWWWQCKNSGVFYLPWRFLNLNIVGVRSPVSSPPLLMTS